MKTELLSPEEMVEADRLTIASGESDGYQLMQNAGAAVTAEILSCFPQLSGADVLCGPGNNGGDGYVVARLLTRAGVDVRIWREREPREGSDGAKAAKDCPVPPLALADFTPDGSAVVVDALYGSGLSKPVEGEAARAVGKISGSGAAVVAIDLPSGVSGASGAVLGSAVRADLTVTFFRRKPGHLLYPGRALCGELVVADIGIPDRVLAGIGPECWENAPSLWRKHFPAPAVDVHKYQRGHAAALSGGETSTGAARLAAMGAARAGAGAVTLLTPREALHINAAHLTATMLREMDSVEDLETFAGARRPDAYVLGPGFGVGKRLREMALTILETLKAPLVLDADAITSFAEAPASLFIAAGAAGQGRLILTPHEGEFGRLFADLAGNDGLSKLDRARKAAARAHGVVVLKGPDTVIAAPDGRAAINSNGTPWLATAGSGDVLAGMIAGLLAQGMPAWEAACAAVWLHAEAGSRFGPGLIAEDLPGLLPPVLRELL